MESDEARRPYLKSNDSNYPALGLVVKGPVKTQPLEETLIRIDTGFEGFLLLSEERYRRIRLHLSELPRRYWPEGKTVTGEVFKLRRALAIVYIQGLKMYLQGYVDTFSENIEDLAGLQLLKRVKLLLNGPEELACLVRK